MRQLVQLLQDGSSILSVTRRFSVSQHSFKSMEEKLGDGLLHEESWTGSYTGSNPAAGLLSAPFCKKEQEKHCQSPVKWPSSLLVSNCQKLTQWGLHEGLASFRGNCAYIPAQCSSLGICQKMPELSGLPLVPRYLRGWEQMWHCARDSCEKVWRCHGECYAVSNIIQHDCFGSGSEMVWGWISMEGCTEIHVLGNIVLTANLRGHVRFYSGAVETRFSGLLTLVSSGHSHIILYPHNV